MILISKTYDVITAESAEKCEYAESGFIFRDRPFSFRDLVELLKEGYWDISRDSCYSVDTEKDYITGAETSYAIHFSRSNHARATKYWGKAIAERRKIK